jgi:predicted TPR repeat methyltransferase
MSAPDFEAAKAAFLQGLQHQQAGRWGVAEEAYRASLQHLPGRPSTLTNLAAVLNATGRPAEALPLLAQALVAEPGNADAWFQQAEAQAALSALPDALASIERVLALQPEAGPAWSRRGGLLKDLGRPQEAVAALQRALTLGADVEINRYLLASLEGRDAPPLPPAGYVQALFDSYATGFDEQLVDKLQYRAPEQLVQGLPRATFASALDLGCGTGLVGRLLRPRVQALHGVDLSGGMLERARALGVYDTLEQADIVQHLRHTALRHELVVAADVFIYLGDLSAAFAGVRRVLDDDGVFAFSVELADDAVAFELRPSSRYAQSERYLRELATAHGFEWLALRRGPLRLEQREPIEGLYAWLTPRPAR